MKKSLISGVALFLFAGAAMAQAYNIENVSKAIEDMSKDSSYPKKYVTKLATFKKDYAKNKKDKKFLAEFDAFAKEALLQNPLIQANKNWIFIKRKDNLTTKALPFNWQGNASLTFPKKDMDKGFAKKVDDSVYEMDITDPKSVKLLFKPSDTAGITDIDINWEGDKFLYSSVNKKNLWQIYEYDLKTKKNKLLTVEKYDEVDNYDGVYLPDGNMIYMSTACYAGVPCVAGQDFVTNIYKLDPRLNSQEDIDNSIRQISFDQESSWMPTVMNDGKVMFTRWEYTDNSHYFSRILMKMNPDGSGQMAHYGTNSYWPNSLFYCRQVPEDPNKFVGIVSGHHGTRRSGELHLFDISKGVKEDQGRAHRYPTRGEKYVPRMMDRLVDDVAEQYIHPYPLSENYIIVSMSSRAPKVKGKGKGKAKGGSNITANADMSQFSLYLIDKFDNITPLYSEAGYHIFEPMPLIAREKPPVIAPRVDEDNPYGYLFLNNVYEGLGLAGVEKGAVKKLRVFEYYYTYRSAGNNHETMGLEACWEVKRVHGTVDVEEDGSAFFQVPGNRPYSIQPLDKDGRALALFRSWVTVLHGETQSCVGCHEENGTAPVTAAVAASRKAPQSIKEFLGKPRGFSFDREVQPILDQYCIECHNQDNKNIPNFVKIDEPWAGINFSNSYLALHPYVRRPGPESNQNMLPPMEFHSSTSELIQLLEKGHKGVNVDEDSMKVIYTWIDLNVPYHGTLVEAYTALRLDKSIPVRVGGAAAVGKAKNGKVQLVGIPEKQDEKRAFFLKKYANRVDNFDENDSKYVQSEHITYNTKHGKTLTHKGEKTPSVKGFPFDAAAAKDKVSSTGLKKEISLNVGNGKKMDLVLIPAGKFVQGSNKSFYDEGPAMVAEVKKPFYMAKFELTNELYNQFDADYDSGHLDRQWKDHVNKGYPANLPKQPVIRVTYNKAQEFCKWLSEKWGVKVSLPTETQWEWAARGGSDKDLWFGNAGSNFSKLENFAGKETSKLAVKGVDPKPMPNPIKYYTFLPSDDNSNDGEQLGGDVGKFAANPFGLYDIAGNVAEWVEGPYTKTLGGEATDKVVARGGSWRDRTSFAKVTLRRPYEKWQGVYNVGIRVIIEADDAGLAKLIK